MKNKKEKGNLELMEKVVDLEEEISVLQHKFDIYIHRDNKSYDCFIKKCEQCSKNIFIEVDDFKTGDLDEFFCNKTCEKDFDNSFSTGIIN